MSCSTGVDPACDAVHGQRLWHDVLLCYSPGSRSIISSSHIAACKRVRSQFERGLLQLDAVISLDGYLHESADKIGA